MASGKWTADLIPSQSGRRVVVTGANSGIGFETARDLARKGVEIVLPARTAAKAEDAADRIRCEIPSATVVSAVLDLASQASIHDFASWYALRYPGASIDLLINNAGVMAVPQRELTMDGFERQFATNFLGPFALTALLYPQLRVQPNTRIVIVASSFTKWAKLDFSNLQSERLYKPMVQAYSQSKLADLLFAFELQNRLTAAGSPIIATSAHPGYAITNIQTSGPGKSYSIRRFFDALFMPIAAQGAAHGALPILYAATSPEARPGGYYGPSGLCELKGYPTAVQIPHRARDVEVAERLWREAERLTGIEFRV